MKKLTFVVAVISMIVLTASMAFAQEEEKPYYFGIKGSFNMAHVWGDDVEDTETWTYTGGGGVFMGYNLHEMFDIMPEVMFMWKGTKSEFEEGDVNWKFYYVDINVLGKLLIPMEGMVSPYLFAGPYFGLKVSEGWSSDPEPPEDVADEFDAVLEQLRSYDVGFIVGGGIDIELSNGHMVVIDARYGMGFIKVFEAIDDTEDDPDVKNQCITISAGYAF